MKKGRKPMGSEVKKQRLIEKFWTSLCLDLRVLDEFQLFNQYYPESKQIFVKESVLSKKPSQRVRLRFVMKKDNNSPLIDCRTIREKQRLQESFGQVEEELQPNQLTNDSFISSGMSVICLNDQSKFKQNCMEKTKTVLAREPSFHQQIQTHQIPRYLQYEPSPPSSPSLSLMQPLTQSFVKKLMDDEDNDIFDNPINWSLSNISVFSQPQQSIEQITFTYLKDKFPKTNQKQYQQLLLAYNHNYQLIQTLLKTNPKQIKILLDKYQKM